MSTKQKVIDLAFDIEKSGGRAQDPIIAIGVAVVDEDGTELGSLCLKGYFPGVTQFEQRTWDEFWSKNQEILETLKNDDFLFDDDVGEYSNRMSDEKKHEVWPKLAIEKFHDFRKMWELRAKQNGWKIETVSDNKVYDGGFINDLYAKYLVGDGTKAMPLPYSANDEPPQYKKFRETHSEQRGLLMAIDPESVTRRGQSLSKRVEEVYDCSAIKNVYDHDHNPAHDAYSIAREAQILNGICAGRIQLKEEFAFALMQRLPGVISYKETVLQRPQYVQEYNSGAREAVALEEEVSAMHDEKKKRKNEKVQVAEGVWLDAL